jgi:IclR family KDG regulon transcriptional repressor
VYKASVTSKTLEVLKVIAASNHQLGVSEIARAVSAHKSTVFGILSTLQKGFYVSKDTLTKKYAVGDELVRFSRTISENESLAHLARPLLYELAESVDETVFLGVCEGTSIKIIAVVEAQKSITLSSPVGTKIPITAGAPGKAYLSSLRNDEIIAILKKTGLKAFTKSSITDIDSYLREMEATRKQGFALDREEYIAGLRGIASQITSKDNVMGVIWIAAFACSIERKKVPQVSHKIIATAQLLSARLNASASRSMVDVEAIPPHRNYKEAAG